MSIEEIKRKVDLIRGQGNQTDISGVLPTILDEIIEHTESTSGVLGDLAELETDHKSNIVGAVNEIFDVIETTEMVVSTSKTTAEIKKIYDECILHPQIAKNIVFYNGGDKMFYRVNGYKIENNVLYLNTIMFDTGVLRGMVIQVGSNGTISIVQ